MTALILVNVLLILTIVQQASSSLSFVEIRTRTNTRQLIISKKVVDEQSLYLNASFLETVSGRLYLNMNIKKFVNNRFIQYTKRKTYDFCKFLENFPKDKLLFSIYGGIMQDTFIVSCPLRTGFYNLDNFRVRTKYIPADTESGAYRLSLELTQILSETSKVVSFRFVCLYEQENENETESAEVENNEAEKEAVDVLKVDSNSDVENSEVGAKDDAENNDTELNDEEKDDAVATDTENYDFADPTEGEPPAEEADSNKDEEVEEVDGENDDDVMQK